MEKTVIDTIKEALDFYDAMEMTHDVAILNMTYDAALAVVKEIEALPSRNDKLLLSVNQLEKQLEQVTKERDAAVKDLEYAGSRDSEFCSICKYSETRECAKRKFEYVDCWEWRGVEETKKGLGENFKRDQAHCVQCYCEILCSELRENLNNFTEYELMEKGIDCIHMLVDRIISLEKMVPI